MRPHHKKLGIKQTIQLHWMDYVVNLMLSNLSETEIRAELNEYLSTQKQSGGIGDRGKISYRMAISPLASWFSPKKELIPFRDHAFDLIKQDASNNWLPYHWAVLSASYPFWFNVAKQIGRLFNLQEQITKSQVMSRLKEYYGDRETVERNSRYAIRSFVAWGVIEDAEATGCYKQGNLIKVQKESITLLLYEAALHVENDGRSDMGLLKNNPAFFPFRLPVLSGDYVSQNSNAIEFYTHGLNNELLQLKKESMHSIQL